MRLGSVEGERTIAANLHEYLTARGDRQVHRLYEGTVSVSARLIGARIEKAILEDLSRSLVISAACTQEFVDRAEGTS